MDETAGTIASEVWAFAATVYSLLAGRSPFEIPGDSNKSTDLISRINRAKPQPIDRADVPAGLERALSRAMSRKPENRQGSVLELVHELQAIETELGVPQTPIEVAVDDWAQATVADLEDRTRVRVSDGVAISVSQRRRKRRAEFGGDYSGVGTLIKDSRNAARSTGTVPAPRGTRVRALAWMLVVAAVLVIILGGVATVVLVRATSGIPKVSDISATIANGTVQFAWPDPGIAATDTYEVDASDGKLAVQQQARFSIGAQPGAHVCITVTVVHDGKPGNPSGQKCVDVPA
jgi:hypothetical protein